MSVLVSSSALHGCQLVDSVTLNFFDIQANSNKFYVAELHRNGAGEGFVATSYGRVGKTPTNRVEQFSSVHAAESKYRSTVQSKIKKGYSKTNLAQSTVGTQANQQRLQSDFIPTAPKKTTSSSTLPPRIAKLVERLYNEANHVISKTLSGGVNGKSSPLGVLDMQAIIAAKRVLQELQYHIQHKTVTVDMIEDACNMYYRIVPRVMPHNMRDDRSWELNSNLRVTRELDLLELFASTLKMIPTLLTDNLDEKYQQLQCDIVAIDDPNTIAYVENKITNSHASNHHFRLRVKNVYEIRQHNAPAFDDSPGNVRHLFHGSRSANLVGILSSYLKLPRTLQGVHRTGAMFGDGIYFASDSTKSANYSFSAFGGVRNKYDSAFLFISEVALGEVYKVQNAQHFSQAPRGYDSVMGVKGSSLINNEFIVYRENQVRLRYLVEIEKV